MKKMNLKINKQSALRMTIAACVLAGSLGLSAGLTYADNGRGGGGDDQRQETRQEDHRNDDNTNRGSGGSSDDATPAATPSATATADDNSNGSSDDQQPRQEDRQEDRREDRREDRQPPAAPITSTLPLTSPLPLPRNDDNPGRGRGHDDAPSAPITTTLPVTAPVEARGVLLAAPASITGTITVNGVTYTLTAATRIRQPQGALTAGACVQVKYVVQNGVNVAVAVKTVNRNAADCTGS